MRVAVRFDITRWNDLAAGLRAIEQLPVEGVALRLAAGLECDTVAVAEAAVRLEASGRAVLSVSAPVAAPTAHPCGSLLGAMATPVMVAVPGHRLQDLTPTVLAPLVAAVVAGGTPVVLAPMVHTDRGLQPVPGRLWADTLRRVWPNGEPVLVWDVAALYSTGERIDTTWDHIRPWVRHVTLSDARPENGGWTPAPFGDGAVPLRLVLMYLGGTRYPGWVEMAGLDDQAAVVHRLKSLLST